MEKKLTFSSSSTNFELSSILRDDAKLVEQGVAVGIFRTSKKSPCPIIFSRQESFCPIFFFSTKNPCPIVVKATPCSN